MSRHGLWVLAGDRERFLGFDDFPWFREVPVGHLLNVEQPSPGHLSWPDLDIDLSFESIENPDRFPLVSRQRPAKKRRGGRKSPAAASRRA